MPPMFSQPWMLFPEFIYTVIVVFLMFLVYSKTKPIYILTKHKGIHYFRITFLLFGLAYVSRFMFFLLTLGLYTLDIFIPRNMLFPILMTLTTYFSTMALFFLAYSTIWKRIVYSHFMALSISVTFFLSLLAFMTHSPFLVSIWQIPLIIFTLARVMLKNKSKSNTPLVYSLVALFWLLNMFLLTPARWITPEFKIIFQLLSLFVFMYLLYRVSKWTK